MAEYNVKINVKTDTGYDQLYPKSKSDIIDFDKSNSNLSSNNVESAIKEVNTKFDSRIGTLSSLKTDSKTNLVNAINEVDKHADTAQSTADTAQSTADTNKTNIGILTNLKTSIKTSIVNAINNLYDNTIGKTLRSLNQVLLATQQGYYADALAVKELYNKFNVKVYQQSQFSLQTFYTITDFICVKQGNLVYINFSVSPKGGTLLSPNTLYDFNSSGIPEKLRPTETCFLNGFACNNAWDKAVQFSCYVGSDGIIKYSAPETRAFYKVSGVWYVE